MLLDPNEFRLMEQFGIRHTLVLRRVSEDDFGNYSCSAENHLGKSRAFIEVSGKFKIWNSVPFFLKANTLVTKMQTAFCRQDVMGRKSKQKTFLYDIAEEAFQA